MFKITGTNRLVLIQKYKSEGWDYDKINNHISYLNNYFEELYTKLKKKKVSDEDIHARFLLEFEKLIS